MCIIHASPCTVCRRRDIVIDPCNAFLATCSPSHPSSSEKDKYSSPVHPEWKAIHKNPATGKSLIEIKMRLKTCSNWECRDGNKGMGKIEMSKVERERMEELEKWEEE